MAFRPGDKAAGWVSLPWKAVGWDDISPLFAFVRALQVGNEVGNATEVRRIR
jgi:hypothetical protein